MSVNNYDVVIVGGGFYGCMLALDQAKQGHRVCIIEKNEKILSEASYKNQAVIHNGYHYPRSSSTLNRSRANYSRFIQEFSQSVHPTEKYYAVSSKDSLINGDEYLDAVQSVNLILHSKKNPLYSEHFDLFVQVEEHSLNNAKLTSHLMSELVKHNVVILTNLQVSRIDENTLLATDLNHWIGEECYILFKKCYITTYASTDKLVNVGQLKHNITEMCLVKLPDLWKNKGITVMDGPFFSLTPFAAEDCHVLTHVTEGVHATWTNTVNFSFDPKNVESKYLNMLSSVRHFYPNLDVQYLKSYYAVKTFIPKTRNDDRPIMIKQISDNVTAIIGSKLDNIYDVLDYLKDQDLNNKNIVELP